MSRFNFFPACQRLTSHALKCVHGPATSACGTVARCCSVEARVSSFSWPSHGGVNLALKGLSGDSPSPTLISRACRVHASTRKCRCLQSGEAHRDALAPMRILEDVSRTLMGRRIAHVNLAAAGVLLPRNPIARCAIVAAPYPDFPHELSLDPERCPQHDQYTSVPPQTRRVRQAGSDGDFQKRISVLWRGSTRYGPTDEEPR